MDGCVIECTHKLSCVLNCMLAELITLEESQLGHLPPGSILATLNVSRMASPCANLFMAELCRRACSTGQQQNSSRNHDNTSMFLVNMYCVLSVNASVARAASVVYSLKMVQVDCFEVLCCAETVCVCMRVS